MIKIQANHYTDLLFYSVDQTVTKIKLDLKKYISGLGIGITSEQFSVLDTIYNVGDICQHDVGIILSKDKSNVKRIVEILEKKQLIEIILGKRNNRAVNFLKITESGKKLIDENIEKIKTHMTEIFQDISNDEAQTLRNLIKKINLRIGR